MGQKISYSVMGYRFWAKHNKIILKPLTVNCEQVTVNLSNPYT
jgi:hypothetical protein